MPAPSELRALLGEPSGSVGLLASLPVGTGKRLVEGLRPRVEDVELPRREIVVRGVRSPLGPI